MNALEWAGLYLAGIFAVLVWAGYVDAPGSVATMAFIWPSLLIVFSLFGLFKLPLWLGVQIRKRLNP